MRIRVEGTWRRGRAIDLRATELPARDLVGWIRDGNGDRIHCPAGGSLHERVGWVRDSMTFGFTAALVDAARTLGRRPPQQPEIDRLTARIESMTPTVPDLGPVRERVATATRALDGKRERVARLGGRVAACREVDEGVADDEELTAAIRDLSEAETEAVAARQALAAAERRAREARDRQETRLSLVDRRDNLRREARRWLAEAIRPTFRRAVDALPVEDANRETAVSADERTAVEGRPVGTALAILRVARVRAPVVLETGPFDRARRASAALDAPVVLV